MRTNTESLKIITMKKSGKKKKKKKLIRIFYKTEMHGK